MKRLIFILLVFLSITAFAQTTVVKTRTPLANHDTLLTTATTSYHYDTLKYRPDTSYHRPKYIVSAPINISNQSNVTITLDSINSNLQNVNQIILTNCSNVHIKKCYLTNTTGFAITLSGCTNVLIDSCVFNKVAFGVDVKSSTGVKINHNQGINRYDIGNTGGQRSHWVQFEYVTGGGNQVNYNRFEDVAGAALHPHDGITIWNSNGKPGDSIQVIGNCMRGGQLFAWPGAGDTGVGITIADQSGTYQVVRGNILVSTGYEGILFASVGKAIKIDHNKIYGAPVGISLTGIAIIGSNQIYCGYNNVNWYKANGTQYSSWVSPKSPMPIDWGKNVLNYNIITANILPKVLITWQ